MESEELVGLPAGFVVRRHFRRTALAELPDGRRAQITMVIAVDDDGRAYVYDVYITCRALPATGAQFGALGEPFGDAELIELGKLIEARDRLMQLEAQEMTPERGFTRAEVEAASITDFDGVMARDAVEALASVRTARRRNRVTPTTLARVLDLYENGDGMSTGIEAVKRGTNYSESYCFKLLRQARDARESNAS